MSFGIIGGSGLYQLPGLEINKKIQIETPYGEHSGPITQGKLSETEVVFLPRHGAGHTLLPSEINYRANIWALKKLGVKQIISVSSVGSLSNNFMPGDFVIPDQYVDWTRGSRASTFFGEGVIAHVSMAEPSCPALASKMASITQVHRPATHICIEGPRYATRAESLMFQKLGCQTIGMTAVPEAFLAREANLCHITLATVTDFDSWRSEDEHVFAQGVQNQSADNVKLVIAVLANFLADNKKLEHCNCASAIKGAVLTPESQIPSERSRQLFWF